MYTIGLHGALLDYWVAKSEGLELIAEPPGADATRSTVFGYWHPDTYHPSHDWEVGGPIVCREWCEIKEQLSQWFGPAWVDDESVNRAPLAWFMRAMVATRFGEQVEDVRLPSLKSEAVQVKAREVVSLYSYFAHLIHRCCQRVGRYFQPLPLL